VVYNKFQYWVNKAERKFADIDVIIQQRVDMIHALANTVKKYDIHEYKTLKDVIESRSRWSKDAPINERVQKAQETENKIGLLNIQALFEKYPRLKAGPLHKSLLGNLSRIESRLRRARLEYNKTVQMYNERLAWFPRKIVARVHRFKKLNYLDFGSQEPYQPKEIFND